MKLKTALIIGASFVAGQFFAYGMVSFSAPAQADVPHLNCVLDNDPQIHQLNAILAAMPLEIKVTAIGDIPQATAGYPKPPRKPALLEAGLL